MARKATNKLLQKAKKSKSDEFYTQLSDIESELKHYKNQFKDKVVYCNCDDPRVSNFFKYFFSNFEQLGLKKLITACYRNQEMDLFSSKKTENGFYFEYEGEKVKRDAINKDEIDIVRFKGDGDFRSKESIELLKQSDIVVVTAP